MTGRFRPEVEVVLRRAGWHPSRKVSGDALAATRETVAARSGQFGGRLSESGFADPVLSEFGGLTIHSDVPGVDLAPTPVMLDPTLAAGRVETLIDLGRALGMAVYPLGVLGFDDAVLAITELGSVIAVDAVGEWFLGATVEEALDLLICGRSPRPVAVSDGRHTSPWVPAARAPGAWLTAGAAFYLPRTPANLPYVWLPDVLVRIGIPPLAGPDQPDRLEADWGGLSCQVHVLDLDTHTVLVLGFDSEAFQVQLAKRPAARPVPWPVLTPLGEAFRHACAGLAADLEAALVHAGPASGLLRQFADRAPEVAGRAGAALLEQDHHLLYLTERQDFGLATVPELDRSEEVPAVGGRLFAGG